MSQTFTKVLSKILTVIFTFSLLVNTLPINAAESKNSIDDLKKIQNNIREKDPQKIQSEKLIKKNKDVQVSNQKDLDVEIDSATKQIRVNKKTKGNTTIGIPGGNLLTDVQTIDNQVVFSNKNAKFDVVVEALDGGVRQVINLKDSSAPTEYDFPVSLEVGDKIVVNDDGSAMVTTPLSEKEKAKREELSKTAPAGVLIPTYDTKFVLAKPWAKDANGKELKTSYSVFGSNLRQTIETKDAAFPIVADPIWCGDVTYNVQFNYVKIYDNRYDWSNQVLPTYCGRSYFLTLLGSLNPLTLAASPLFAAQSWQAWSEVYNKTNNYGYYNGNWYYVWNKNSNYWGMYNQYICHLINPQTVSKYDYNLEPWRSDPGLIGTYYNGCNPPR